MRLVNLFSLTVILVAALFTWQAVAAEPMRVHLMHNLSKSEAQDLRHTLTDLGYQTSEKSLFSESHNAIIITKALENEREPASLTVELVQLENEKELPRTLFQYRLSGNDLQSMAKALPKPEAFSETLTPVMASK